MLYKYKIGLRAIKTAISVFICLILALFLNRSDQLFSSMAAIICMQKTYTKSFEEGVHRLIGTLLGGVLGYIIIICTQFIENKEILNIFISPFCILIVIYFCNVIRRSDSVVIGCIVVLSVIMPMNLSVFDRLVYVINRVIDTSIGIIVAMLVNKYIFPHQDEKLQKNVKIDSK